MWHLLLTRLVAGDVARCDADELPQAVLGVRQLVARVPELFSVHMPPEISVT